MRLFKKKLNLSKQASVTFVIPPKRRKTYIAVTFDGNAMKLYVNGELVDWKN